MGWLDKILKRAKPELRREAQKRGIPTTEQQALNRVKREVRDRTKRDGQ
jgi:hypothetical protein